jgi:hypothetical protein
VDLDGIIYTKFVEIGQPVQKLKWADRNCGKINSVVTGAKTVKRWNASSAGLGLAVYFVKRYDIRCYFR